MRNAGVEEAQAGIKIAGRNIKNLRYADDTTLMAESIFIVAPFLGAALSAVVWNCLGSDCKCCKKADK